MNAESFTAHRPDGVTRPGTGRPTGWARPFGRRRLRVVAVAGALLATVFTSACAAGQQAQTAEQVPTIDGTEATIGNMQLRGLAINAPSGNYYPAGSNATVKVIIVNDGQKSDQLTGLSSSAFTGWGSYASTTDASSNTGASRSVTVGAGLRAAYSVPTSSAVLQLTGIKDRLFPGSSIKITFTFARSGSLAVTVPVALSSTPGSSIVPPPSGASEAAG